MDRVLTGIRLYGAGAPAGAEAIALSEGRIAWAGRLSDLPVPLRHIPPEDFGGRLATPALVDCHTHLVFGGDRAREWELRLEGASYEEIAAAGGGILATMAATRAASEDELVALALPRLDALLAAGAGTVEIKSGYGLTVADELKMLRAARRLATLRPVRIVTSWLAAHAVPPEYRGRAMAYIEEVAIPGLREAAASGLADAVDGFCEAIAFTPSEIDRLFAAARAAGLPVKLHAEQRTDQGGAALAARHGALSADHLEHLSEAGIRAMAAAGTVAVLLPGAFYVLRDTRLPPVAGLRAAGVPVAVATDANPGSSPLLSPLLALNMACTLFRLTPAEALDGMTVHAARALGLRDGTGTLAPGAPADLCIWEAERPAELAYWLGRPLLHRRVHGGRDV